MFLSVCLAILHIRHEVQRTKEKNKQSFKKAQQVSHHIPTKSPQPRMPPARYALERQSGETKEPNQEQDAMPKGYMRPKERKDNKQDQDPQPFTHHHPSPLIHQS